MIGDFLKKFVPKFRKPGCQSKSSHSDALNDRHLDISKMPGGSIEPERSPPSAASDIGGQEKDGFRDLLRLPVAFHWYARDEVSLVFGSTRDPVQHARLDRSPERRLRCQPRLPQTH